MLFFQHKTIAAGSIVRPVIGRREYKHMHSQHVEEQEGPRLFASEHRLGNDKDRPFHGRHFLELALPLCLAELAKGVHGGFVSLFEGFQIQVAGVLSGICVRANVHGVLVVTL